MERTMTIKKFFAPSTTRLGRQQWFRNVWQRLTMVLMLVMLTTATAWAEKVNLSSEGITVEIPNQTYTGNELTPEVTVKNGDEVVSNEHYTIDLPEGRRNAGNYTITITAKDESALYAGSTTATFTINKATPSSDNPPTASAIFYGERLDNSTLSGHPIDVNGDELSGTWAWVAPTTMPNVSDSGTTEYSVVFTPTDYTNYEECTTTTTLTINKAPLTITANSKSINYGDAPANDGVTYGGFVNGENKDNLGGTLGFEYTYTQYEPVGTYQITPNGLTSENYDITFVPGTLIVDKKSLTVAADDITIDHGAAAPAYTYTVTGLVNGESLTTEPALSCDYAQGDGIGTYLISISGAAASANYTISYTPGTLTVQSKKYTVTFVDEDGTQLQSSEVEWGETPAYTGETPTKDATAQYTYTFAGWTPEIVAVTEDATYTATYSSTPVPYTVNYVLYGGTNNPSNPTTYTCESAITLAEPTAPENSGYTFSGWYTDANFENSVDDTAIPQGTTGEKTFYACWLKELGATVIWDDDNNKYGVRGSVIFYLSDGTNEKEYQVQSYIDNLSILTPKGFKVHKNGEEIVYTWRIRDNSGCYEQSAPVVDGNTTTFTLTLKTHDYCGTDDPKTTDVDESKTVTWNYNTSTKTITIAGSGPMMYYNSAVSDGTYCNGAPWRAYAGEVEHVVISDGITYVGSNTFAHCPNISNVTLPTDQHLYEIGPGAFGDCTSLTSIDIPMSVNKINDGAFAGCSNLASVTLGYGDGATFTIGTDVFPATTTIIVPLAGLLSYLGAAGWSAYADKVISTGYCGKDNTETTDVDESHNLIWTLRAITKTTDQGMTLETVTVDDKVLAALKLTVSANTVNPVNTQAKGAFDMADGQYDDNNTCFIFPWGIGKDEHVLAIRDVVIEDGVTSIGSSAFRFPISGKITNATIGKDVKTIDSEAFRGTKLANVTFAANSALETIGDKAFQSTYLTNITIPASVKTIGGNAFESSNLATVTIEDSSEKPSQLTTIADNAFERTKITTITLPKSVKDIYNAFRGCTTLQTVNFAADATIEAIGYCAFYGCTALQSITIPASVTMIESYVFLNCTSLSAVNFAENSALKVVDASAFDGCTTLTQNDYVLTLPTTVTDVFAARPSHLVTCLAAKLWSNVTEKLSYSSNCGVEVLDYVNETTINSANNVQFTMRSNGTLSDNSPALRMNIYKNTEDPVGENFSIADYTNADYTRWADVRTNLTAVLIEDGVEGIGNNAFNGCSALTTFRVMPTTAPALGSGVFDGCTALTIIAPASYKTADGWQSEGIVEKLRADREDLFTSGTEWMTWCGDFDWSAPAGCSVYVVSGVDEHTVTLTALTETANADRTEGEENAEGIRIPAYTPVILQKTDANATGLQARFAKVGTVPASGYNATTGLVTKSESNFNMLGNATDAAITEGGFTEQPFYSLYNGKFYRYEGTQAIATHRCILTVSPVYTAPVLTIGTETTSVVSIDNGQLIIDNDVWYTLDGRKLDKQPTKKGIYINGGRKVVIK